MFITHELHYFFSIQHGLFPPPPMAAIAVMTAAVMRDCAVIVMFIVPPHIKSIPRRAFQRVNGHYCYGYISLLHPMCIHQLYM